MLMHYFYFSAPLYLPLMTLILALSMLAGWRVGFRLGVRASNRGVKTGASKFNDASLAVLGLLLAFTFGMSLRKHDNRRDLVATHANAIAAFYTDAGALREPMRTRLRSLIRTYLELSLAGQRLVRDEATFRAYLWRGEKLQQKMRSVVEEDAETGGPFSGFLLNALNNMDSATRLRIAAFRDRLPLPIVLLLLVSAVIATVLIAREQGIAGEAAVAGTLGFILLVCCAIYVTMDLNLPHAGFIRQNYAPLRELLASILKTTPHKAALPTGSALPLHFPR